MTISATATPATTLWHRLQRITRNSSLRRRRRRREAEQEAGVDHALRLIEKQERGDGTRCTARARGSRVSPGVAEPPVPGGERCADEALEPTVAYGFLVKDRLPMWPAWRRFFAGCPAGSFSVVVHAQWRDDAFAAELAAVGGVYVAESEVVRGESFRFRWLMVQAMIATWRAANRTAPAAGGGCPPQWLNLNSDSCAPCLPCAQFHARLRRARGYSLLDVRGPGHETPFGWVRKAHQWGAVWSAHAMALVAREEELRRRWEPTILQPWSIVDGWLDFGLGTQRGAGGRVLIGRNLGGAVDEYLVPTELDRRGWGHTWRGPTFSDFPPPPHSGHPIQYTTPADAHRACRAAVRRGYAFARKFGPAQAVDGVLANFSAVRLLQRQLSPSEKLQGGPHCPRLGA